jgi:hypothetical protein
MKIKEQWNSLNQTEKVLIGMVLIALIMIALRWEKVSDEVPKGFKRIFSKPVTE